MTPEMPFVSIRLAGSASKEQKAGIVADVTESLVTRLGKNPAAVQIVIEEVSTENYGAGGTLIADRPAAAPPSAQEVAPANGRQ
jgi:4-oxalocrotonate tautomerase